MAFSITVPASTVQTSRYQGKNRSGNSLTFDSIAYHRFTTLNLAASQAASAIQDALVLPQKSRVVRVGVTAQAVSGSPTVQVVVGSSTNAASVGLLAGGNANGLITLTCNNYAGQTMAPYNMSYDLPSATVLTLRAVTTAADTATGVRMSVEVANRDEHPQQPLNHALGPTDF